MRSERLVRAFHGTTLENAMNILRVGFQKTLGVCGMGAYFDIRDSRSAVERAIEKSENPLEARIIEVELHLGNCIDLQAPEVVVGCALRTDIGSGAQGEPDSITAQMRVQAGTQENCELVSLSFGDSFSPLLYQF